jgi:hypothetical protein
VSLQNESQTALAILENSLSETAGTGLLLELEGLAQGRVLVHNNLFADIGDGVGEDGLQVRTLAGSAGGLELSLRENDFATVAGTGLHLSAGGDAGIMASIAGNYWSANNSQSGDAAVLVEQADASASGNLALQLTGNTVESSSAGAYLLRQQGSGWFQVEGVGGSVSEAVLLANEGQPVNVQGTVTLVEPGTYDAALPALVGGRVWQDADGDGIREDGEAGMAEAAVTLASGAGGAPTGGARTLSDRLGQYRFIAPPAGQHTAQLDIPPGYRLAEADRGDNDLTDSEFRPATGQAILELLEGTDDLTIDAALVPTWANPADPRDVNGDGFVTPQDVLILVNDLNANTSRVLPAVPGPDFLPPYLDVNDDRRLTPQDVLIVINFLNRDAPPAEGEAGYRLGNNGPPYCASAASSSSMRSNWLYFAMRSLREAEPVLI